MQTQCAFFPSILPHGIGDPRQQGHRALNETAQGRAREAQPLTAEDSLLSMQREVIGVLGDEHVSEQARSGDAAHNGPVGELGDDDGARPGRLPGRQRRADRAGSGCHTLRDLVLRADHPHPHERGGSAVDMLGDLLADPDQCLATRDEPLWRLDNDLLDRQVLQGKIPSAVRGRRLLLGLPPGDFRLGALAELGELSLHGLSLGETAPAGPLQRRQHRAESELDLGRVDSLRLLPEELSLQPLQLERDEEVELLKLVPLVLGPLCPTLELVPLALQGGELLS